MSSAYNAQHTTESMQRTPATLDATRHSTRNAWSTTRTMKRAAVRPRCACSLASGLSELTLVAKTKNSAPHAAVGCAARRRGMPVPPWDAVGLAAVASAAAVYRPCTAACCTPSVVYAATPHNMTAAVLCRLYVHDGAVYFLDGSCAHYALCVGRDRCRLGAAFHRIYTHIRLKPHPHDMTPTPGYVAALPFLHDMLRRHCPCDIPRDMVSRTADPPVHARRYPQRLVAFLHSQEDPFKGWSALGIIPVASQASGGLLVGQVGPRLCPPAYPIVHPRGECSSACHRRNYVPASLRTGRRA